MPCFLIRSPPAPVNIFLGLGLGNDLALLREVGRVDDVRDRAAVHRHLHDNLVESGADELFDLFVLQGGDHLAELLRRHLEVLGLGLLVLVEPLGELRRAACCFLACGASKS